MRITPSILFLLLFSKSTSQTPILPTSAASVVVYGAGFSPGEARGGIENAAPKHHHLKRHQTYKEVSNNPAQQTYAECPLGAENVLDTTIPKSPYPIPGKRPKRSLKPCPANQGTPKLKLKGSSHPPPTSPLTVEFPTLPRQGLAKTDFLHACDTPAARRSRMTTIGNRALEGATAHC